jgi:Flp pilus assembly protein TadD
MGPITGPLDGIEAVENAETEIEETAPPVALVDEKPAQTRPAKAQPAKARPAKAQPAKAQPETKPTTEESGQPAIPTQNLPRDPAKASDVLVHRALPLIRSGQLRLAEATLDRAWELDPKNPQAMAGYASLFIAKNDGARAAKWAKKAVRKRGRRAEYHVLYGDALRLEGETEAARKAWRKALLVDPENRAAKARLAETGARVTN